MSCDRNICYAQDYNGGCETCPCNGENKTELVEDKQTLLNCPFCGGEVKLRSFTRDIELQGITRTISYIACDNNSCLISTPFFDSEEEAVKRWNTRKPI